MDAVAVAEQVAALDREIARLHAYARADDTEELAALVASRQIDELLEQRHKLVQRNASPA